MSKIAADIGIVGSGGIAHTHLQVWRTIHGVRVTAVCDINEQVAKKTAEEWNIPTYYTDLGEMLGREALSAVDICTPPKAHCHLILQALESGCHVIVEKPLAETTEEAKIIISAQEKSGRNIGIIHNALFMPPMPKALSLIRGGQLGRIINVDIAICETQNCPMLSDKNHWCHSLPGGRFGEILIHPIYLIQAILGQVKVMSTHAIKVGNYPWVPFDELRVNLQADKAGGSIYVSFNSGRDDWSVDVYGTRGILKINLFNATMSLLKQKPLTRPSRGIDNLGQACQILTSTAQSIAFYLLQRKSSHRICIQGFVDNVLNNKAPLVTLQEAYNSVEMLEEICEAIEALKGDRHRPA